MPLSTTEPDAPRRNLKLLNWSAVLFAFLQSVCSAFIALNSIRLFIGVTVFASALGIAVRCIANAGHGTSIPSRGFSLGFTTCISVDQPS